MTTEVIAGAFIEGWVAQYGVPHIITTDLGRQFESTIFRELSRLLGIKHIHTTAYHPQANGMVERMHRTLKAALRCHNSNDWTRTLPLILLGLRTSPKEDLGVSSAEMLYGNPLRVPGQLLSQKCQKPGETDFVSSLRNALAQLKTINGSRHGHHPVYVPNDLLTSKFVFVRVDRVRAPLEQPYEGPFQVLQRDEKYFVINRRGSRCTVSLDRLKPAYLTNDELTGKQFSPLPLVNHERKQASEKKVLKPSAVSSKVSRSGRTVHFPAKLCDYRE
ncbi:uncharacterized protein LOC119688458 [Teleopsis dalmanni]|uniref:uncharacterized protein LOC119688458 n=1 Tax=Teleopsis dalmanni TaxID=139649 RepID=UPI0018CE4A1E|nr:uncharacterized protein LOC119688458 [Teleopsis dalmanni]